ncbi:hypothetical protein [Georgenia alba]|uniref:Uncharacterized protein n=1 Tax=Georgenia alba TaxID=2233858 RepID=A0ABW2Q836_9MICO
MSNVKALQRAAIIATFLAAAFISASQVVPPGFAATCWLVALAACVVALFAALRSRRASRSRDKAN